MIEDLIINRINDNRKIFTNEELKIIFKHKNLVKKIYILGVIDAYGNQNK